MTETAPPLLQLSAATVGVLKKLGIGLAAVAVVVLAEGWRYGWLDYRPSGNQLIPAHAALVVALLAVPAAIWLVVAAAELITGDLHYGDTGVNDIERYREVMDLTLSQPAQSALYRSTPIAYVWDDHDYGPNAADGNPPSRQAAMESYRYHVPPGVMNRSCG